MSNAQTQQQPDQFPQTTALKQWVEAERAKGLVDIKFFKANTNDSTVESFAAEVNQMITAPKVPDHELF